MSAIDQRPYFFDTGLRFECQKCGTCCTGAPGVVSVCAEEVAQISAFLNMNTRLVAKRFLCNNGPFQSISEYGDGRCRFYADGCLIYPVRPWQCRTYPFWFTILRSEKRWRQEEKQCAGIGKGKIYSREAILERVARDIEIRSDGKAPENSATCRQSLEGGLTI